MLKMQEMFYVRKLDREKKKKKAIILVYLNNKWVFSTIQTSITKKSIVYFLV